MNLYLAILIVVVNAAIFTHFDAARLRDSFHVGVGPRGIPPHSWAALVFLFLPLALPYYFGVARGTAKQAAAREGPPPRFTARDLNAWGYVASVAFLALAIFLGLTGRLSWAALAGLCMVAGLFGGRKAVQMEGKGFELGGAAWDMSGFRPLDDDRELDDGEDLVASGVGGYIPPLSDGGGNVRPRPATSPGTGGVDVFSPPKRFEPAPPSEAPAPARTPITAAAAPVAAFAATSSDDDDVWDPVRADEEAERARSGAAAAAPPIRSPRSQATAQEASEAPPASPPAQPVQETEAQPTDAPSPAATRPLSAQAPVSGPLAPPAQTTPPPPPPPASPPPPAASPPVDLGEELPPGLVDDEPVSLLDDDLAPFELAPDEDDEDELPEALIDDEEDEDLDVLAPLPPLANLGSPRPAAPRPSSTGPSAPGSAAPRPQASRPAARGRDDLASGVGPGERPSAPRPRGTAASPGGFAGKASSTGPPAVLIWVALIAAILGVAWWLGTRNDGAVDEMLAEVLPPSTEEVPEEESAEPAVDHASAAEEAMRRQMNEWIATYDAVMRPIAELVEEIDFETLGRGSCLELQRQANKANTQLRVAPDDEVELLLRPAFKSFVDAGRACSAKNEVDWSVHLLQAKDHTHETQLLLDERYRYVGPFELEQEEALGHQRSLETISGRYLAGELAAQ